MHGLGNDFLVIDAIAQPIEITSALAYEMADRHTGIGFDQLLLLEPARQLGADFSYRIFNADGSEVSQCGNGARCVGRYLYDAGYLQGSSVILGTAQRNLEVQILEDNQVAVNMGLPLFAPQEIPFIASAQADSYFIELPGEKIEIAVVNLGNPHAVIFVADIDRAPVERVGALLEKHDRFPERVNVGFMQCLSRDHIRLRVYERGVGETLACGSGACAAVTIGRVLGLLDAQVQVDVSGGALYVKWIDPEHPVWLMGTTETVFKGEWLKKSC